MTRRSAVLPVSSDLPLESTEDPYATVDDEILIVVDWQLTWHECCELCSGIVPVRMKRFAEAQFPILEDARVHRLVVKAS